MLTYKKDSLYDADHSHQKREGDMPSSQLPKFGFLSSTVF